MFAYNLANPEVNVFQAGVLAVIAHDKHLIIRPERSQRLLYKQRCHWLAHRVILLLTYFYGPAKPKRNKIQQPVIGAKLKLHCKAIELVCGGSPKLCVVVEWKALDRVKSEIRQPKPVWISCLYSTSVQSWMK